MNQSTRWLYPLMLLAVVWIDSTASADDWPQWRGKNRDGVWREDGIVDMLPPGQLKHRWSAPISSGYSGPTVADGRVFVMDRVVEPKQIERVHCFDADTGENVWTHAYDCPYEGISYDAGPRASVTVDAGRAYSLGSAGHLFCFEAATGNVVWQRDLNEDYKIRMPNWGIAASPLIWENLVVVQIGGEDGACLVALDRASGKERWKALTHEASYSSPIMIEQAGKPVLVCWTGEGVAGLDPNSGRIYWEHESRYEQWPIAIATPVWHNDLLFFSEAHKGSFLLRLIEKPMAVDQVWHRRDEDGDALHCLISTPYIEGDYIYGADERGVLRCLELASGNQVWQDESAVPNDRFATIHLIPHQDHVWLFNERGELILGRLTPQGYQELSRAKLLDPTTDQYRQRDGVTWSHPAFAYRRVFARNDKQLVCVDLAAEPLQTR